MDYHRVTADNTKGAVADHLRVVTFAQDADAIATGKGDSTRFACDALQYEWPPQGAKATQPAHDELDKTVCAIQPTKPEAWRPVTAPSTT